MILGGEDELECEIHVDGVQLEQVSEFRYLGHGECHRKVMSGRKVAGAIRSLDDAKGPELQDAT